VAISLARTENKRELVQDLTRKAKQIEYLIRSLPDKEDPHQQVSSTLGRVAWPA
jgi:hypothetical protein